LPQGAALDGEDLSQAWLGHAQERSTPLLWEYRRHDGYLKPAVAEDVSPNVAIRVGRWKLLVHADGSREELYDLANDARETQNLKDRHPDIARRLREQALAWRRGLPKVEMSDAPK